MKDWPDRGTLDKSQLNEWSTAYPDCNFGVITGNGLVVLDVDNKNNKEGSKVLSELGEIPQTFTVATPSGGFHYYFKSSVSLKSRNFNNGLEIKSTGNQVVAEGSTIDGKLYKVINDAEIAEFPIELIENLANLKNLNPVNRDYSIIRPVQWDEEQEKALQRQLDLIDPSLDYNSWLRVLFACLNIFGQYQDIITLLNKWSLNSIKYDKDEFWKKITSYNPNHHEKIGYPALKEIQWKYPKRLHPIARNDLGSKLELLILNRECAILEKYENKPSQQHKDALKEITTILAHGVDSNEQFRIAIPLETGMGKTTCVVALASELAQYDKGLLICAERIEQLADMQVDMINAGVSASKIGIYHKKHGTDIPSINFEEMQNYQYLLVSHARVQNDSQNFTNEKLLKYKNKKRCLTIWDESLITTESYYCSLPEMVCAIKDWLARFEGMSLDGKSSQKYTKEYELLNAHLQEVRALLEKEFDDGTVILLPYLSTELFNRNLINNIVRDESYRKSLETLITFIQLGEVRVVKAKDGSIIMQFVQRIADSFDKVIVMDASSRIRTLLSFDKTVSVLPLGINKYFNDVEIFHADVKSSKSSFIEDRFHLKNYLKELAHLIDNVIPKNEALIVFCHKDQKEEIRKWTERSYPLKEIHTLNWGEHRASNNYCVFWRT